MSCRCLIAALALTGIISAQAVAAGLADTLERVRPSVVAVGTVQLSRRPPGKFVGTGFVVGRGGHVITNAHVVPEKIDEAHKEFLAVFSGRGKGRVHPVRVLGEDRTHDLVLLELQGATLPALRVVDSAVVREGEKYAFTGFPIGMVLGLYPVTHRGIIASITPLAIPQLSSRSLDPEMIRRLREPYEVFQLDATAYPGNSGSPLYDPGDGRVVGVINKVFVKESKEKVLSDPSAISYAIPSVHVLALMRRHGVGP